MESLQHTFYELVAARAPDPALADRFWEELKAGYTAKGRYYHTLDHLQQMLLLFTTYRAMFHDPEAVLYALFYHDIVYDPQAKDNEAQSALLAAERMRQMQVPEELIQACCGHISATAGHGRSADPDTNLFTDIDLAVLGAAWPVYEQYYRNIRREYAVYPDLLYNPGRRKVLQHFLALPEVFKTTVFLERFEKQAMQNMQEELQNL